MARHRKLTQKFAGFPMFKLATSGDTFPVTSPFTTGFTGLVNDELALDLQFATDKTLTARKGPTPVFTRASTATFVGSNGLVRYAPNNAALYSGQLVVGTGWAANATPSVTSIVDGLGPDGNNAYEVAEIANTGSHTLFNTGGAGTTGATSVVSGTTYTGSIFIKKLVGSIDWIQLSFSAAGFGSVQYANFNISNGTIGNFSSSSPQIQDAGNGWYRCSISVVATTTTATSSNLFLTFTNNADTTTRLPSYAGNTANKVLAAMCQFEIGSTVNTYNPTTTAAFQGPRFDHDPVTLACKGLLIEESRTNLILQSENLGTTWALTNATVSLNVATAPDGSTNADKIINTSGGVQGRAQQSFALSGSHVYSVFAKAAEWGFVYIAPLQANGGVWFDLTNGTVGAQQAGFVGSITPLGNGWYRCSVQFTGLGTLLTARIHPTNINNVLTVGDGTSGIFIWGAQVEAGSFPTSYIPTTTASLARSADVCSITGSDFSGFWNRFAGTCVIGVGSSLGTSPRFVSNLVAARTLEIYGTTNIDFFEASGGQEVRIVTTPIYPIKLGLAYAINDYQSSYNGLLGGSDTNTGGTIPNATELHIGNLGAVSNRLTGHIQSIRYFKKRLANQKLQSLTV